MSLLAHPRPDTNRSRTSNPSQDVQLAAAVGAMLGLFCAVAHLTPATSTVGQMVAPWVLLAALAGALSRHGPTRAAVNGGVALVVANAAYYLLGSVIHGVSTPHYWVMWTAVGAIVGPAAGLIGWHTRCGRQRFRVAGAAALAAVCVAESIVLWGHIAHTDARLTYAAIALAGALLPVVVLRSDAARLRVWSTALAVAFVVPLAVTFEISFEALGIV